MGPVISLKSTAKCQEKVRSCDYKILTDKMRLGLIVKESSIDRPLVVQVAVDILAK